MELNAGATFAEVIETHPLGIVLRAPMPVTSFLRIVKRYKKQGYTRLALNLCGPLKAVAVLVKSDADADAWSAQLNDSAKRLSRGDREMEWLLGTDTGTSSLTIFSVLGSAGGRFPADRSRIGPTPSDPSDFGRCYRLLEIFPEWRERLPEVASRFSAWRPLVENWPELEAMYREELPKGTAPRLYARMKELLYGDTLTNLDAGEREK